MCRDIILRSWVPIECQTESWRYDMSSELSLRLSPQRPSDRRASTWANMSRELCHTSPTHRYSPLLWQLMGLSGKNVSSLGGRVGVVFGNLWIPGAIQGSVERCYSQRSVNAQSTLQSTLAEMYKNVPFGENQLDLL